MKKNKINAGSINIFQSILISLMFISSVYAQTASILPPAETTFFDSNGNPLTSGTVESFIPSTNTHKTTWKDSAETIPNSNPLILDAAGRALLLGSGSYRQLVKDRTGNIIWDQVTSSTGSGGGTGPTGTGDGDLVGTIKPWAGIVAPNQYMFTYGQTLNRVTNAALFNAITSTQAVFCSSGSPTLSGLSDTTNFWIGMSVEVSCITAGFTTIIAKTSTSVTLAVNANASVSANVTFFPWGNGNHSTTFTLPDFRGLIPMGNNIMGGIASSNISDTYFGSQGASSSGGTGGNQSTTLITVNLPPYTPAGTFSGAITGTAGGNFNTITTTAISGAALQLYGISAGGGSPSTLALTGTASGSITGTAQGGVSTAFSNVSPSKTVNFIIKVTPDANSATASGVTSLGGMTGDIACGIGLVCTGNNISVNGSNVPHTQDFLSGGGFTPGSTTTLTLSSTPSVTDLLIITFDGIGQNANTWGLSGNVITFNAAIPLNTQVVEAKWSTTSTVTIAGVSSVNSISGALNLVAGTGITLTPAGQNITVINSGNNILAGNATSVISGGGNSTIGNNYSTITIQDAAYNAKCNAVILSTGTISISVGTPNLTVTAAAFTINDVGKSMWVPGAGVAGGGLSTTILTFTDATHVVLASNASTTVTAVALTQASFMVYGNDDTAAINSAIAGTPAFGTLIINPITAAFPVRGCLIKQSGATGRSLLVDHPINIKGFGNSSALITDPSMALNVIDIHALVSGVTWKGIRWEGFLLGTDTNFTNFPRFGSYGIWFDATTAGPGGFAGINIGPNLAIGEANGGFYSLVLDGVGTQGNRIENNFIEGGIYLNKTADSNMILNNRLLGVSTFGILIDTPGAGNFIFSGNSTTLAAGICIDNGSGIVIANNFFEEATASVQYAHNAFIDIGCSSGQAVNSAWIHDNIIITGLNATSSPIKNDATSVSTFVYANEIVTSNARAGVTNSNATAVCGPNQWITATPHFGGTAPINWGPAC